MITAEKELLGLLITKYNLSSLALMNLVNKITIDVHRYCKFINSVSLILIQKLYSNQF